MREGVGECNKVCVTKSSSRIDFRSISTEGAGSGKGAEYERKTGEERPRGERAIRNEEKPQGSGQSSAAIKHDASELFMPFLGNKP